MLDLQSRKRRVGRPETTSARAFKMLYAIWRYGNLGTKAVHVLVAPEDGIYGVSKELIKLETRGLIEGFKDWQVGFRWFLTPKGYSAIELFISEIVGVPSVGVETQITEIKEFELHRWCRANQDVLLLTETLLESSPQNGAESVLLRELSGSKVREKFRWLPRVGLAEPASLVYWPDRKRGKVFAIDVLPAHQGLSARKRFIERYRKLKVDGIFLVYEYVTSQEEQPDHFLRHAFDQLGIRSTPKWNIIHSEDLVSGNVLDASIFDIHGVKRGRLDQVLLTNYGSFRLKAKGLSTTDLIAKPKVWGRAYQR